MLELKRGKIYVISHRPTNEKVPYSKTYIIYLARGGGWSGRGWGSWGEMKKHEKHHDFSSK